MIYLAGKMSGAPARNLPLFARAARVLREHGEAVYNPHENPTDTDMEGVALGVHLISGGSITEVRTLIGWEESRGARLEVYVANELGIPVAPFRDLAPASTSRGRCDD